MNRMMMMMMMMMHHMQNSKEGGLSEMAGHRAVRRQEKSRNRAMEKPRAVISEYLEEAMESLGVEAGDAWQLHQFTLRLGWGRNRGLLRTHYHVSQA